MEKWMKLTIKYVMFVLFMVFAVISVLVANTLNVGCAVAFVFITLAILVSELDVNK